MKNIGVALGHTMLEEPEVISVVAVVGFVVLLVCLPAYAVMADARPEILSINPDKLL